MVALYATLDDFKSWVTVTETVDDGVIVDGLAASSAAIDNYCDTHFWQTTAGTTRLYDACNPYSLRIDDAAAVTAVATDKDSDGTFETIWAGTDYQLLPLNPAAGPEVLPFTEIRAIATQTFPQVTRRLGLIRVTGTWGWPTIPEPVMQACLLVTNRLLKRRRSPEGLVTGFEDFGAVRISRLEDPDAVRFLTPYRTQNRVGGWAFA